MRVIIGLMAVLALSAALSGCIAYEAASTIADVGSTVVGAAADVGSTAVGTAADTVSGTSSDDKSGDN